MAGRALSVTFIGFGEAAQAFAGTVTDRATVRAYDRKTDDPATRAAKQADCARFALIGAHDAAEALLGTDAVLSLVTADQALAAAETGAAAHLKPGAFWFDCNSVAPDTKRAAAGAIGTAGGRYVDVAVMSPVYPQQNAVPLLVSGPHAAEAVAFLESIGFANVRTIPGPVGAVSAIKMIRSVMVKGIEALTAECVLAAEAAGVLDEVLASLDASDKAKPWRERADYNLDRMMIHGRRRAAEMYEVTQTLGSLGISPMMSEGTVDWQQGIGDLEIDSPEGLSAKLAAIAARRKELGA
jgi:3-hydroxyisobutyrate dehydrogenase-like beta-hydroxyacid dehydrogenase